MFEWIDTLSTSAAQFWGVVGGVGGGLTTILIGALFNASLNRRRDDRLRYQEAQAVASAIRGEMSSIRLSIKHLMPVWEKGEREFRKIIALSAGQDLDNQHVNASEFASLPPSHVPVFEANANRIGLLGSDLAGAISVIYSNYRVRAVVFEEPLERKATDLPEHYAEQIRWANNFCVDCEEFERLLIEFERLK